MYFVYIIRCADNSLYTGITTDVARRFSEHKNKKGGHYTSSHGAEEIVYTQVVLTKSAALKREAQIKRLSRKNKLELIRSWNL